MRVRWRRIFNPISRKPVRMKLTGERYPNARYEKEISAARIVSFCPYDSNNEQARGGYSSDSANFANTVKSSSVVVSPVTCAPLAISFSNRRMILPLRVFGSGLAQRTSFGFVID